MVSQDNGRRTAYMVNDISGHGNGDCPAIASTFEHLVKSMR